MIPTTLCLLATAILAGAVLVTPQEARALQIRKGLALAGTGEAGAHAKRETTRWRMQDDGRDGWVLLNEDDEEGDSKKGQIKLVPVTLGVMSRCPDAILCEGTFDKVLSSVGDKVDLELLYIGSINSSAPYGVDSKHGAQEVLGDVQQLCARSAWPSRRDWWSFIQCQNYAGLSRIGDGSLAESCAKVGGHSWADAQDCVDSKGRKLIEANVRRANHLGVQTSCSIYINSRLVCIHDEVWRNCDGGHEVRDFVRQIEREYDELNK